MKSIVTVTILTTSLFLPLSKVVAEDIDAPTSMTDAQAILAIENVRPLTKRVLKYFERAKMLQIGVSTIEGVKKKLGDFHWKKTDHQFTKWYYGDNASPIIGPPFICLTFKNGVLQDLSKDLGSW